MQDSREKGGGERGIRTLPPPPFQTLYNEIDAPTCQNLSGHIARSYRFEPTANDVEGTLLDLKQNVQIGLPFINLVSFTWR